MKLRKLYNSICHYYPVSHSNHCVWQCCTFVFLLQQVPSSSVFSYFSTTYFSRIFSSETPIDYFYNNFLLHDILSPPVLHEQLINLQTQSSKLYNNYDLSWSMQSHFFTWLQKCKCLLIRCWWKIDHSHNPYVDANQYLLKYVSNT